MRIYVYPHDYLLVDEAIKTITNDWVEDGNYSEQTVINLRDVLIATRTDNEKLKAENEQLKRLARNVVNEAFYLGADTFVVHELSEALTPKNNERPN